MKATPSLYSLTLLPIFLAALAVLVVAWFVPLPPIIAGEEALAAQTIPTDRTNAQMASQQFQEAQARYQSYIKTHDLGALLTRARAAIANAKVAPKDIEKLAVVRDVASQVED